MLFKHMQSCKTKRMTLVIHNPAPTSQEYTVYNEFFINVGNVLLACTDKCLKIHYQKKS